MKTVKTSSIILIVFGAALLCSEIWFPVTKTVSLGFFGYTGLVLGLITFLVSYIKKIETAISALFFSGLFLCILADKVPWWLYSLSSNDDDSIGAAMHARDSAFIFLPLGLASIVASWILIILYKLKTRNEN